MAYIPRVGDKVFLRSNEPDPLRYGIVVRLETYGGKARPHPFAVVRDEKTNNEYVGGHVCEYSADLHVVLEKMRPIEQWNYLTSEHSIFQIPEKYGVKYKTF